MKNSKEVSMIGEDTAGSLDFRALRDAIEGRNPDLLLGFYSEDAELRVLNGEVPESAAFELRGRAEIERYLRAVCDQEMTCSIEGEVVLGEGRITFAQRCAYPEGNLISVETTLEIGEGGIVRHVEVAHSARRDGTDEGGERQELS